MPKSRPRSERGRARRGFTLLEVLGAVLVLALLYSVLAEVAIQGLRAEGESRRRLEASLFADELLADIEASIDDGDIPLVGVSVEEEDPYIIELEVNPMEAGALLPPGALGEDQTLASRMGNETDESPLREILLRVSWSEGDRELSVTRTTLALETAGLAPPPGGEGPADEDAAAGGGVVVGGGGSASADAGRTEVQKRRAKWDKSGRLDELLRRREERRRRNQN